ncbi:MAG: hypothetical protein WBA84_07930 [Carnobacterium sp.]|uniref:hypothetical protein n=1 Tax=Carnobacterium sp. TaxID=48221 RepID=UPI003C775831
MFKCKKILIPFALVLSILLLVACNQTIEKEEDDYYFYVLSYIEGGKGAADEINFYMIQPFEKTVLAAVLGVNDSDAMYDLEKYEDKEDKLTFRFNGITETLEKKSDSLWQSLETGIKYDVKRIIEKPENEN